MGAALQKMRDMFFSTKMDICVVGLENSGKTTFINYLNSGQHQPEAPTIGMNVKVMKKGGVTIKAWDLGGQKQYRSQWGQYTRGCQLIAFVIDTTAPEVLHTAKQELHQLLEDRELSQLPLLILANKIDLGPKISEAELIRGLNLDYVVDNPWAVIPISAKNGANIDRALEFLIKAGKDQRSQRR